ncbi:NAD(P)-binding protein [Phlegmacium glaucopus]|nr:NAD(P)-binding protein [Phlegmacium glaucopus]
MSKVILVTGANTGIGFELVRLLAEKKHTVYLGARNETAGRKAEGQLHAEGLKTVKFVHIDVTDTATLHAAKEVVENAEGTLDVLVNNAAINTHGNQNATSIPLSTLRETLEVNFFGVIQTTVTFLPLIRRSTYGGIIVNVSSLMGSNSYQANPDGGFPIAGRDWIAFTAYNSSKAALNSYTIALAHELKEEGIKVNAITPGLTSTKMSKYTGKTARGGAEVLLRWALLEKDGPTGRFIGSDHKDLPW